MFVNLLETGTETGVLKRSIGTGNKSIDYKSSVCTFPFRKSSKGICGKLADFLTNAHRKFQLSKFSRFSVHGDGPLQVVQILV